MKVQCVDCRKRFSGSEKQFRRVKSCRRCGASGHWWLLVSSDPLSLASEANEPSEDAELLAHIDAQVTQRKSRNRAARIAARRGEKGELRPKAGPVTDAVALVGAIFGAGFKLLGVTFKAAFILLCLLTPPIGWIVLWMQSADEDQKMMAYAELADAGMLGDRELQWLERRLRS